MMDAAGISWTHHAYRNTHPLCARMPRTRSARHDKLLKVANIERGCLFVHGGKTSVVGGVLIETPE
jgi:hypothetical protein